MTLREYLGAHIVVRRRDYVLNHWVLFFGGLWLGMLIGTMLK